MNAAGCLCVLACVSPDEGAAGAAALGAVLAAPLAVLAASIHGLVNRPWGTVYYYVSCNTKYFLCMYFLCVYFLCVSQFRGA